MDKLVFLKIVALELMNVGKWRKLICKNPSKHSSSWRRLEDVFRLCLQKTSSRRLDEDEYILVNHTSSEDILKTSWPRPIYSSCPYIFKTSSRRFQDDFKTSSRRLAIASSRRLQNVFKTCRKYFLKTFSRRFEAVSSS